MMLIIGKIVRSHTFAAYVIWAFMPCQMLTSFACNSHPFKINIDFKDLTENADYWVILVELLKILYDIFTVFIY